MAFWRVDREPPSGLHSAGLILRPLGPEVVELDYQAVVSGMERLRLWSQTDWPWEGFTLADNRRDLEDHYREFLDRDAFAYTVVDAEESVCLGCVYIDPLDRLLGECSDENRALVRFWARSRELERALADILQRWLKEEWPFDFIAWRAAAEDDTQCRLLESMGLRLWRTVHPPGRRGPYALYADAGSETLI